jgi:hypothetical protein
MPEKLETADSLAEKEKPLDLTGDRDTIAELIQQTNTMIETARTARATWVHQLDRNYKWRRGMVGKPRPDVPFRGSADYRYRRSEREIRKLKPLFVDAILQPTHIVRFIAANAESTKFATDLEAYYDYFYRFVMSDFTETADETADCLLENGLVVTKNTMKYESFPHTETVSGSALMKEVLQLVDAQAKQAGTTLNDANEKDFVAAISRKYGWPMEDELLHERAEDVWAQLKEGEETIAVIVDKEIYDNPYIGCIRMLTDIIVPPDATNIQESQWVAHEFLYTERQLLAEAEENGGRYKNVFKLLDELKSRLIKRSAGGSLDPESKTLQSAIERAEGLSPEGEIEGTIAIREVHRWIPRKHVAGHKTGSQRKDRVNIKAVLTYASDVPADIIAPLRMMEEPYNHGRWPFRDCRIFSGRRRFYSGEGVVQSVEQFEREENISRNMAIDRDTIALNPPVLYHENSNLTPNTHRQIGQWHPVRSDPASAVHVVTYPNMSPLAENGAQRMEMHAQDMVGTTDLRNQLNYTNAPTATQVEAAASPSTAIRNHMLRLWVSFWTSNFRDVFELHKQYLFQPGTDKVEFPDENQAGRIVALTPEHFQGDYIILAGADLSRMNPVLQAQNEFAAFQMLGDPKYAWMVNPYDAQFDFISSRVGPVKAKLWLLDRQAAEENREKFMEMQAQAAAKMAEGKRTRQPKIKQMPGQAGGGLMPQ